MWRSSKMWFMSQRFNWQHFLCLWPLSRFLTFLKTMGDAYSALEPSCLVSDHLSLSGDATEWKADPLLWAAIFLPWKYQFSYLHTLSRTTDRTKQRRSGGLEMVITRDSLGKTHIIWSKLLFFLINAWIYAMCLYVIRYLNDFCW